MKDYYKTLGVERTASADEIKKAYRRLASQHHPDKGGDVKKFQELEEAYRILSDPQQRAQYDNPSPFGGFGTQNPGFSPFDFDSIFDIFGARFGQGQAQRPATQLRMTLWIRLEDVAQGGRRTISIGTHQGTSAVEIEIPLGIDDGDNVRYPKIGPNGADLIVGFRIHPNARWQRDGLNLYTEHTVDVWDLILGCDIPVRDILNNNLSLTVPARTQPGTVLRLRGKGLRNKAGAMGDLLVRIQGRLPDNIPETVVQAIRDTKSP